MKDVAHLTHTELHEILDTLVACWLLNAPGNVLPSTSSVMSLMQWSCKMMELEKNGKLTPCQEKLTNRI